MVLAGLPVARAAETARATEPEPFAFGEIDNPLSGSGEEPAGDEVVEARTETTRTYETEIPGVFATVVSAAPINFEENGEWVPIDASLVPTEDGFENAANEVQIEVADSADAETVAELSLPGASVGFGIEDAEATEPAVGDDTVTYQDVVDGADVELQSLPSGLKETIVLDSAAAPTVYSFPLTMAGVTPRLTEGGAVEFVDGGGAVKFVIPPGYMEDSSLSAAGTPALSQGVSYALVDGGHTLEVTLDQAWLTDPARVFPVMVDPTVNVYSNADDTFVANVGSTDRSGYYNLKAGYDGTYKFRSFLHFDMSAFEDMNVVAATLKFIQNGSGSCTASPLDVFQVTEAWTGSTTTSWPGPDVSDELLGTINSGAGHDGTCPYDYASTDMTRLAQYWSEGMANNGISLRARDENSTSQFKQVGAQESYYAPRIEVLWGDPTVASAPNNPSDLTPTVEETTDPTPTYSGTYSDPQNDDGEIVFFGYDGATGAFLSAGVTSVVDSGNTASHTPTGDLPIDYSIIWRAIAVDTVHDVGSELSDLNAIRRPSVQITAPSAWSAQTSNFSVSAALDAGVSGVTGVQFLLDGTPVATDNSSPYSTTVNISGLGVDAHDLTAKIVGGSWGGATSSEVTVDSDDGSAASGDEEEVKLFVDSGGVIYGPADADNATEAIAAVLGDVDPEDAAIVTVVLDDPAHPEYGWEEVWTPGSGVYDDAGDPVAPTYSGGLSGGEQTAVAEMFVTSPGSGPFAFESAAVEGNPGCSVYVDKPVVHGGNSNDRDIRSETSVVCGGQTLRIRAYNSLWRIRSSDLHRIKKDGENHEQSGQVAFSGETSEDCDNRNLSFWQGSGSGRADQVSGPDYLTDTYWGQIALKHCFG
jgi:hypothetical protein